MFILYLTDHTDLDCTAVLDIKTVRKVISQIRRLCFALHIERYKRLSLVPHRKRSKKDLTHILWDIDFVYKWKPWFTLATKCSYS